MRHDWNSLLSDDESLLMTRYSKQFFPDADILVITLILICFVQNVILTEQLFLKADWDQSG